MTTCTPSRSAPVVVTGYSAPEASTSKSFVQRNGSLLQLEGQPFRASGPNIYWLGLDENVPPSPSRPSHLRILEILATVVASGGNAFRCHTCGISVGCTLCMNNALGQFNEESMQVVDFVLEAARQYGLRVVIPLTDQYDYYHGGIASFLRWRNLSATDHSPFYDTSSETYADFTTYVKTLLTRENTINGLQWGQDPTVLAFETGNELANPPLDWTLAVTKLIKSLAPNILVMDGSYGVSAPALDLDTVDMASNHFYPLYASRMKSDAALASRHNKAYMVGELDWTDRYQRYNLLGALIPFIFALAVWTLPKRWFPVKLRLPVRKAMREEQYTPLGSDRDDDISMPTVNNAKVGSPTVELPVLVDRQPRKQQLLLRKWHLSLFCALWIPISIGIAWTVAPTSLHTFLGQTAASSTVASFYWSLFGTADDCCTLVQHDDGYTLHWPGDNSDMRKRAGWLADHARQMTGKALPQSAQSAMDIAVACPQMSLSVTRLEL